MEYIGIIHNLALLIVLIVLSGYLALYWRHRGFLVIAQGVVYGAVAVTGMIYPLNYAAGIIFDGRSVVLSLCGLLFGPIAVAISTVMAVGYRLYIGGSGSTMGFSVIVSAAVIGTAFHYTWVKRNQTLGIGHFLLLGILVHIVMLLAALALPPQHRILILHNSWHTILIVFPIATVIIGKILTDQMSRIQFIEKLAESEEKFRAIADYTVDWESWFAPDGSYTWVNPGVKTITGYSAAEILSMPDPIDTLIAEEDRDDFKAMFEKALQGSPGKDYVCRYRHKDGSIRWLSSSWHQIFDSKGNCLGVRSSSHDITKRKKIEQALRHSEEKFSKTFYLSPDAININRISDGKFVDVNQGFTANTGYTKHEVIGRSALPGDLGIWVNLEDRENIVRGIREKGEVFEQEAPFRKKNGDILIGLMSARIFEINGEECLITVTRDITEQRMVEEEKRRFYRDTIKSVTQGKLDLATKDEVNEYLETSAQMLKVETLKEVAGVRHSLVNYFKEHGMEQGNAVVFESAVGEAITNAIKHATDCRVYTGIKNGTAWVGVSDSGTGISNEMLPDATLRIGFSSKISMGMGYAIMMETSDGLMLCTGESGTTLVLFKKLSSKQQSKKAALDQYPDTWKNVSAS